MENILVVGAGTMGRGIAQSFASAAYHVTLYDVSQDAISQAKMRISKSLSDEVRWGIIDSQHVEKVLSRIETSSVLAQPSEQADLVIEAVFEDLDLKRRVFAELDSLCPPHTILASNTSSFMPSILSSVTNRPDRVLVAHYFYPAALLPLVELVCSQQTSEQTLESVHAAVKSTGKVPIVALKEAPGFIANRLQCALLREALHIVAEGIAQPSDVDRAVTMGFGRRLAIKGPLETSEVQDGWEVIRRIHAAILPDLNSSTEPSSILGELIARGELGPMTGKGFYDWPEGAREKWEQELFSALAAYR